MAQQTLNNGESGLIIRGKINDNFTELYQLITLTDWDMSTKLFPANSVRGQRYIGINGPTLGTAIPGELGDINGDPIANGSFLTSLIDNASTTNPAQWAINNTITQFTP